MPQVFTHIESCVKSIYSECYYRNADHPAPMTEVVNFVGATKRFHTERLEAHRDEIVDLLRSLPLACRKSSGSGLLCAHAHIDKHGQQWATSQDGMIKLFELGAAIDRLTFYLPLGMSEVDASTLETAMILFDDEV